LELTYQYSNFGVPGLGLKRGLSEDAVSGEWKTEASLKIEREETHAIWRGVTG